MERYALRTGRRSWASSCARFRLAYDPATRQWSVSRFGPLLVSGSSPPWEALSESGILDEGHRWATRSALMASLRDVCEAAGVDPPGRPICVGLEWETLDRTVRLRSRLAPGGGRTWLVWTWIADEDIRCAGAFGTRRAATEWAREQQARAAEGQDGGGSTPETS